MPTERENFKELLAPIFFLLDIEAKQYIVPKISELIDKYKSDIFKNQNSLDDIRTFIKQTISECLIKIDKSYLKRLKKIYTETGIITILYDYLNEKLSEHVSLG